MKNEMLYWEIKKWGSTILIFVLLAKEETKTLHQVSQMLTTLLLLAIAIYSLLQQAKLDNPTH